MKKIFFTIALAFTAIQFSNAQISFGVKGGMNIDINSEASKYIDLPTGFTLDTDKSSGYHAGVWLRVKVPVVGLYVRPEINFTNLSSEYTIGYQNGPLDETATAAFDITKIDVPVLLGLKVLKFGNIFIGPNFQYLTKSELSLSAPGLSLDSTDDTIDEELSIGMVAGVGLEVWKLGLDVRFETGFNIPDENIGAGNATETVNAIASALANKNPNQIIIGLSYKF
jgi:hypothetical protein